MAGVADGEESWKGAFCLSSSHLMQRMWIAVGLHSEHAALPADTERRANLENLYEGHREGHIRHIPKVQGTAGTQHNGQETGCKEVHPWRWPKLHRSRLAVHPCCRSKTVSQANVLLLSSLMSYVSSEHCWSQPEPDQILIKAGAVWDCTANPCKVICSMRAGWGLSLARLDALCKSRGNGGPLGNSRELSREHLPGHPPPVRGRSAQVET